MKNRFAAWQRGLDREGDNASRRTVGEIRRNAEKAEQIRKEKQARARKREEDNRRKAREKYLKGLAEDFPKAWKTVQKTAEGGTGHAYDSACRSLVDLSEAYAIHVSRKQFEADMKKFMANNMRRAALIRRLVEAGIWKQ